MIEEFLLKEDDDCVYYKIPKYNDPKLKKLKLKFLKEIKYFKELQKEKLKLWSELENDQTISKKNFDKITQLLGVDQAIVDTLLVEV